MAKQPTRANPPVCWECNRKLYMGGWSYVTVIGHDGHEHAVHAGCADEARGSA